MKADPFVQLRLLDLQALDTTLDRLAHRRRTLPELAEIERLEQLVAGSRDEVVRAETEAGDLARQAKKQEDEIDVVRARRTRDEQRLAGGAVTSPKQLEDLQSEVASLVRRQSELEDRELEIMERAEEVQGGLDRLLAERDARLAERDAAGERRDVAQAEIDEERARVAAERAELAPGFPADLLNLYEKLRAENGGSGVGPIERGRCGGCRLDLMGNEKSEVRAAPADEVLRHEGCGRIMVRTAESGL